MKKYSLFLLYSLFLIQSASAQHIQDVQAYSKTDGSRFVALLSDQTIWWYTEQTGWQKVPTTGLPANSAIKYFNSYVKLTLSAKNTRLVVVLKDNSMWWYADGDKWERIPDTGLPRNASVKIFRPYVKFGSMGGVDTRFLLILDDNTMWWYANEESWKPVATQGLPRNYDVRFFGTYQKAGMMGSETRYLVILADQSIWWYADNKMWQQFEARGLPANPVFKQFEAYSKLGGSLNWEGRLIGVMGDESIWWLPASGKEWKKLDVSTLPKGYKIRSLKVYQKYPGLIGETRVIVVLEDNSIWWYAEGKNWIPLSLKGLPIS